MDWPIDCPDIASGVYSHPCPSVVAVAFPEVLGDHFTELVVNLGKIAESGKRLQIVGPSPFLRMQKLSERL